MELMAKLYKVSADISEKEKVIGGILTAMQGVYIGIGILITAFFFYVLQKALPNGVALIIGLFPGILFGYFFAFHKVGGLDFVTYLIYKRDMKKKTKQLQNDYLYEKKFTSDSFVLGKDTTK